MFKSIFAFFVISLSVLAFAQGSASGYGQGGGGGGFGGGGFGGNMGSSNDAGSDENGRSKDRIQTDGWATKSAILTPSDKVTFKFDMKKGDSLFASVESDAFDPGLSIVLDKKELVKVDDREEGDQSPFIAFRAPQDGTYELNVLSFRSLAGGKFTLKSLRLTPIEWSFGKRKYSVSGLEHNEQISMIAHLEQGKAYEVNGDNFGGIMGPTGVESADFEEIPTGWSKRIFFAKKTGDFYFRLYQYGDFEAELSVVPIITVATEKSLILSLDSAEARIVEFPIKKDLLVHTTVEGQLATGTLSIPGAKPGRIESTDAMAGNNTGTFAWFKLNQRGSNFVRVFHMDGTARVVVRNLSPKKSDVKFFNRADVPEWDVKIPESSSLDIGETKLYVLNCEKSELIKVALSTNDFEPRLDIFRLNGLLANTLMNTATHKPTDDLYFPEKGTFLVRISCNGFGGKGQYELKREVLKPTTYTFGTTTTLDLTGSNFGLYSVYLVDGKRYEIMTEENGLGTRVDVIDPSGEFITTSGLRFEKSWVQYFIPKVSGQHRLWLRGGAGKRRFVLRPFEAPAFDPVKK